jgi:hypothetical protein
MWQHGPVARMTRETSKAMTRERLLAEAPGLYQQRLAELAAADPDQPLPGTTPAEVWAIGAALLCGLQIYQHVAPDILTTAVFERACELVAGLYPED